MKHCLIQLMCLCWVARFCSATPDPSLLLWLPFDEGRGDVVSDCSAHDLEADLSNVQWAAGAFGSALHFGGTNAFVEIPSVPGLNGATQFTLSVWATWDGPAGRYPNLLSTHTWCPGGLLLFVNEGTCSFRMGSPEPTWSETGVPLLSALPQHQWVHLCLTFAQPRLTAYVNGRRTGEAAWPHPIRADALRLGGWNDAVCHSGLIDDLRIYDRAFSAAEVAALANDASRRSADATLSEAAPHAQPLAATYENRQMRLAIDTHGRAVSMVSRATGHELLDHAQPFVYATLNDGTRLNARRTTRNGDALSFDFGRDQGSAVIAVQVHDTFLSFAVRALSLTNTAALTFCTLAVKPATYCGTMANMLSDDADAVCLRGLDLSVEMAAAGHTLSVSTTAEHGLVGGRADLAAGPKPEMPVPLRAMAKSAGVSTSKLGGPWSLGAEDNRGSYLFADLAYAATDDWIELARRGGFSTIHIHGWWQTLGHYDVNTNLYPRGVADLRDAVARIHAAGLRAGIHTLTGCIEPRDAWTASDANADFLATDTYTLARPLSPTDTVLYVKEPLAAHHDVVFTYMGNGNALRIGTEIVQYAALSRTPPYGFSGCTRGAFGTRAVTHTADAHVDYLQQRYIAFYPKPDSPLAAGLADHIAAVFNSCRLDQIYMDGSEGMMSRYGIDAMRRAIFQRLHGDPLVEASCHGAHNWWFHARLGAWDHPVWASKRFHDLHIAEAARYRASDLLEPQMGWWAPRAPSSMARGHFLDEMEYFACKNLGLDAAMSIQGVNVSHGPLPVHIEKQLTLLGWYEHLRLARAFDAETLARIAVPGDEFRLRQDRDGTWRFTPVQLSTHRVSALGNGSEMWSATNPYAVQPLCVRIETLYGVAPHNSPQRRTLLGTKDFSSLKTATASRDITLALSTETADTPSLRLRASNAGASRRGAWARATLDIPPPYRNLKNTGAFGVWIKGDGSGALLNLQLVAPREYTHALSDHYVTLDFTGWRYTELLARERDAERMSDYVWPYSGLYEIYRNPLDMTHIAQINLYLNEIPPRGNAEVSLRPADALPTQSTELKNAVLTVNGEPFALPFALASGDFAELEPDGSFTRYNEAGTPLACARPTARPALRPGTNTFRFACETPAGAQARADVTLETFGVPFGSPATNHAANRRELSREYEMPHFLDAHAPGSDDWEIAVRPGETARLEIELCGALEAPALTIGSRTVRFPITLKPGERLSCIDGRHWTARDAQRRETARGTLDEQIPEVTSGTTRIVCSFRSADHALVKLVKTYR